MFYPNHHIRTYCIYLGSLEVNKLKYDMGVYVKADKSISHAIVYGSKNGEYISGEFIFQDKWLEDRGQFRAMLPQINRTLYKEFVANPTIFPQPKQEKQS